MNLCIKNNKKNDVRFQKTYQMSIKKELGEKIKRLRKKRGLTQEQLAEMINVAPRTLSGIEIGENFVTADTLDKIISSLNTTSEELFATNHLKTTDEMLADIIKIAKTIKDDREKLEVLYRIVTSYVHE